MGFWQRQQAHRGASRKQVKKPPRQIPWQRFVPVLLLSVGFAVLLGLSQMLEWAVSQPVSRVAIRGDFQQIDRQQLTDKIEPLLAAGFIRADLEMIRFEVESMPWVFTARVERRWPDQLTVHVVEQMPIAQWGESGFLNHRGELFRQDALVSIAGLPVLSGPDERAAEVMENYRELGDILRQQGLELKQLTLDERANWSAVLAGGVTVVLGADQVMEKMRRFVKTYQVALAQQFDRVQRIDMRYSNGLAVAWREAQQG